MKQPKELDVIIIGAGITGIGAAYYVQKNGMSYQVIEQNDNVGGIWHTQRWHGSRCDSAILKYSYSFMPYLSDKELIDRQKIQNYLSRVVHKFKIHPRIKFKTKVIRLNFDTQKSRWEVYTNKGTFYARFVIGGYGYFTDPYIPNFKGIDRFKGEILHTFDLDAKRTFHDKNVVLIGSGSTAIACAPVLSEVTKSLVLLQRSPSYIFEIDNKITNGVRLSQKLYKLGIRFPVYISRYFTQFKDDMIFILLRAFPKMGRWIFKKHWISDVGEKNFYKHFHPTYDPWTQRIPVAIHFKEKLLSGKFSIKTDIIEKFTERAILLKSGESLPCDTCILATGFHMNVFKMEMSIDGKNINFSQINFYKGAVVGGVPNYFHPIGVLHSAWTQRSESATKYAIKMMNYMKKKGHTSFMLERKKIEYTPSLSSNYVLRYKEKGPRMHGSWELPSFDNILFYWFIPSKFRFK